MLNWPKLALSLLRMDSVPHTDVLDALARGIRSAEDIATSAGQADESYEDAAQWAIDEQCENIEVFLGIAYITLQTRISHVVSHAISVRKSLGKTWTARELMALGKKGAHGFSKIEVLWALANYFKHRDEWHGDWSKGSPATVKVIRAVGLDHGSTGNLRIGAEALGLGTKKVPYSDLNRLNSIVQTWALDIHKTLDAEVKKLVPPPTRPPVRPKVKTRP